MKDSEPRGIVLKFLYERRREDGLLFGEVQGANSEQHQTITDAFERVVNAIDNANVSEAEKQRPDRS